MSSPLPYSSSASPQVSRPPVGIVQHEMDFFTALKKLSMGARITRTGWNNENLYGFLRDSVVMIHLSDGNHFWTIHVADMEAKDWYVVPIS